MPLRRDREGDEDVLFVNFNQEASCISVGARNGYRIYNCHPFGTAHVTTAGGVGVAEMLHCTSLVALVGGGQTPAMSPRQLQIFNTKTGKAICELNFISAILSVRLNRRRVVVVLESQLQIFELETMKIIQTLETARNSGGLCALSPNEDNSFLAFATSTAGEVVLYDALHLSTLNAIAAHTTAPAVLSFSGTGRYLATASKKGTVIRVFSVPAGEKLTTLRRGSYPSTIHSLAFAPDESLLCASSSGGTVHIFKLWGEGADGEAAVRGDDDGSWKAGGSTGGDAAESEPIGTTSVGSASSASAANSPSTARGTVHGENKPSSGAVQSGGSSGSGGGGSYGGVLGALDVGGAVGETAQYLSATVGATVKSSASAAMNAVVGLAETYVPSSVFDVVSARSFAHARMRFGDVPSLCSLRVDAPAPGGGEAAGAKTSSGYILQVVTIDGFFSEYKVNPDGGECRLVSENVLRDARSEEIAAHFVDSASASADTRRT